MLNKILISNFKVFESCTVEFTSGVNLIVGDNESGKSTLLEAIHLVLTGRHRGSSIQTGLNSHLFSAAAVEAYIAAMQAKGEAEKPEILIELFLEETDDTARLKGTNNSLGEDAAGVRLRVHFDNDYSDEYAQYVADPAKVTALPVEYWTTEWKSFAGSVVTGRSIKVTPTTVDSTRLRMDGGTDYFFQRAIESALDDVDRRELAHEYRQLRALIAGNNTITKINQSIDANKGDVTTKTLSLSIDNGLKSPLDAGLLPHLDDMPLHHAGSGEQHMLKILMEIVRRVEKSHVILIEEPENHLSHSSLRVLLSKIEEKCGGKQVLVVTHSSYVLNRLGLDQVTLLANGKSAPLAALPASTTEFFKKLPGYNTLRMVLAGRVVLVEGPSDELIFMRAFKDIHGEYPADVGVDVISAGGLVFKRFFDIARLLDEPLVVALTDNDGDEQRAMARYEDYTDAENIRVFIGHGNEAPSLEQQVVAANDLALLGRALGKEFNDIDEAGGHMKNNKTECALKLLEFGEDLTAPDYVVEAVNAAYGE